MNSDEIGNMVRQLLTLVLSGAAASTYVSHDQGIAIAAGAGACASVIWSIAAHWGKVKVPASTVGK